MVVKNRQVRSWFNNQQIVEAILGRGAYFIPDVTYRDKHNRLLIIDQLFDWAKEHSAESLAAQGIENAIEEASRQANLWDVFDIVWTYIIIVDDRECNHLLTLDLLRKLTTQAIKDHPITPIKNADELKGLIEAVNSRL